jgi:hypothetical protein
MFLITVVRLLRILCNEPRLYRPVIAGLMLGVLGKKSGFLKQPPS